MFWLMSGRRGADPDLTARPLRTAVAGDATVSLSGPTPSTRLFSMPHDTGSPTAPFIVIEGLDGSGKSTLARDLAMALGGIQMTTPSPALRDVRETILLGLRGSPIARQAFYLATLAHAADVIRPVIGAGRPVVLDRYLLSTMVYAAQRGEYLRWAELEARLLPADVTVFLDVPLHERKARLERRGMSAADIETLDPDFDAGVRRRYLEWSHHPATGRFVHLHVAGHESPSDIAQRALSSLEAKAA